MKMMPHAIILDSNALIYSVKYKTDLDKQLSGIGFSRIIVPDCVAVELTGLSARVPEARAAVSIADRFESIPVTGKCDSAIVDLAQRMDCAILTNDLEIVNNAKSKNLKVYSFKRKGIIDAL